MELAEAFEITRSLPHGHVAAVLGTARRLGIEELIDPAPSRKRNLVLAMLIAQVIAPASKLAFARALRTETATSSLGELLGVSGVRRGRPVCGDGLGAGPQGRHRKRFGRTAFGQRHAGALRRVLGRVRGPVLPAGGDRARPRRGPRPAQIVYGLLCTTDGVPVAIEVFEGNTADPKTLAAQITKLKTRFGLTRVCLVGDRGMLTSARIRDELRPAALDWITALRAPQIKALVEADALQLSLFDEQNLVPDQLTRTTPASGWCAAATRRWPPNAPANATSCWPPPKTSWTRSPRPPAATGDRCAGATRSRCGWAR